MLTRLAPALLGPALALTAVTGAHPVSRLVRCSAATGACERVPGGPLASAPATMS
ncbi:hypothetical protein [Nocardioides sp. URHA0020]|uniref:hypothetical protein n=1 Tax=Nocardioides sp. URHA0020 TaxID=1380392 RepID=UPI000AA28827|nr:hypothetical protein [Nocardioides sp. URHA0020]